MNLAYRVTRNTLATTAAIALIVFFFWHMALWRMGEVYRQEGGITTRRNWTGL